MKLLAVLMALPLGPFPSGGFAHAIIGSWVGTLEYRDYSDNSRQRLGTLLRVSKGPDDGSLVFRYVYDDGPHKVVQDEDTVRIDEQKGTYLVSSNGGKETEQYSITGIDRLSIMGYGTFRLAGKATENGVAVDVRETIRIQSKGLDILRESKLPGKPWLFRHEFVFSRVEIPR